MYDVIIIGAGPAGISASLYTKRANLKTLIIYKNTKKSALDKSEKISNYYGFEKGINGKQLYLQGIEQAKNLDIEIINEEVTNISKEKDQFQIQTLQKQFKSKTVILATGNKKEKPDIQGLTKLEGKGISYCAICDGFFFKDKNVGIIGNGDYAISETMDLINIVNSITILTNGEQIKSTKQFRNEKININNKKIKEIIGENKIEEIQFEDNSHMKIDGIFIAQGVAGSIDFAKKIGAKIKDNNIIINEKMETNIKGLYACGDCTGGLYQISKSVYEGTKAGLQVIEYLKK